LCREYVYQKLLKLNNPSSRYGKKILVCFFMPPSVATHFFVAWSVCLFSFIFVHPEDFQAVLKVPTSKGRGKEWERLGKKGDGVEGRQSRREREEESPMFSVLL